MNHNKQIISIPNISQISISKFYLDDSWVLKIDLDSGDHIQFFRNEEEYQELEDIKKTILEGVETYYDMNISCSVYRALILPKINSISEVFECEGRKAAQLKRATCFYEFMVYIDGGYNQIFDFEDKESAEMEREKIFRMIELLGKTNKFIEIEAE